jgi:hypothetical protein
MPNMGKSYGLKRKGVDLSQGPPKRKRDVVRIPAVIEKPLLLAEKAPSSSGWHRNVVILLNLMMSSLSWAFPSYMLNFDFSFFFFLISLSYIFTLLAFQFGCLDKNNMK